MWSSANHSALVHVKITISARGSGSSGFLLSTTIGMGGDCPIDFQSTIGNSTSSANVFSYSTSVCLDKVLSDL